jgi:hypothetical protein
LLGGKPVRRLCIAKPVSETGEALPSRPLGRTEAVPGDATPSGLQTVYRLRESVKRLGGLSTRDSPGIPDKEKPRPGKGTGQRLLSVTRGG